MQITLAMKRQDIYGFKLSPGDLIVWSQKYTILCGKIHSFTATGMMRVYKRTLYGFEKLPVLVKTTDRVVKVEKFPQSQQTDNQ
jgi:hypothetical protein